MVSQEETHGSGICVLLLRYDLTRMTSVVDQRDLPNGSIGSNRAEINKQAEQDKLCPSEVYVMYNLSPIEKPRSIELGSLFIFSPISF